MVRIDEKVTQNDKQPKQFIYPSWSLIGSGWGIFSILVLLVGILIPPSIAQTTTLRVVVNSNQDTVQTDDKITLREAIEIVNGTLPLHQLSTTEKAQILPTNQPQIEFNLPRGQTAIALQNLLPPLTTPGLVIDGTTQPGYDIKKSATSAITIPIPVVSITAAENRDVFRGLTVVANNITIRGLSLYGFTKSHGATATIPPGDIIIASWKNLREQRVWRKGGQDNVIKNVVIENNWLGILPDESMPHKTSAFGVSVFNAMGTVIQRNRISYHDGSAIITGIRGEDMQVQHNIIVGNGIAGMPDAIRLDGKINNTQITSNLICGNDGSGIYLFKPEGSVKIQNNQIKFNGRRLRRAAVYLMGNNHRVMNNQITNQTGSGVVVTSYPQSRRNLIQGNHFANLEGLSIDLNTRHHTGVQDFQRGDGPNPQRDSGNRRRDTGNGAINTPKFLSREFLLINGEVGIDGKADPGTEIDIYRVIPNPKKQIDLYPTYSPLGEIIAQVKTDDKGRFSATLDNIKPGEKLSAIATDPRYGTSEPSANILVRLPGLLPKIQTNTTADIPKCTTPIPPVTRVTLPPPTISLTVPRNIHFALDKDNISPESAVVLDKIAEVLQKYPTIVIELEGHTDSRASIAYNQNLALRRARSTRNYLIKKGIAPERMTIRSFGERKLLTEENNRVDYARNRRVEIIFQDIRGVDTVFESQEGDLQIEP
ncbi:OmpA family protein [Calothrix rhizosoleniae]|uniref:OmpA family protein n=1 Tax=Calothrix rhizosoleniae TaxID=888997 RepID=UPI000B49A779|nr:OmpA family protein [Calothrix rhizosoleniae]